MKGIRNLAAMTMIGVMTPFLAGCLPVDAGGGQPGAAMPKGAILVSEGVYAVPIAVSAEGCEQFSQWSALGATQPVILYHDGVGGFTATKSDRFSCNADMVNVGRDSLGCPTFRAEQPNGKVTDVLYYPSGSSFTANPARATCNG